MNFVLFIICLIVIIGLIVTRFEIIVASGESMYPTVKDGELVLIYKPVNKYAIKEGKIYVVQMDLPSYKELVIKRLIKSYNTTDSVKIWLEGDNKPCSYDSRKYGYVNSKFIVGRVIKIWKTKKK